MADVASYASSIDSEKARARFHSLVAKRLGLAEALTRASKLDELLTKFGFQLEVCESGVVASLRGKALASFGDPREHQRLRRSIDATVEAVMSGGGRPAPRC
jgi:hypothetical protein